MSLIEEETRDRIEVSKEMRILLLLALDFSARP